MKPSREETASAPKPWFVYLLRCSNGCLYTGIATDVQKRLAVHNAGQGSAYVRAHRPAKLVAFTAVENRSTASKLEYAVKALRKTAKLALAKKWNAELGNMEEEDGRGKREKGKKLPNSALT